MLCVLSLALQLGETKAHGEDVRGIGVDDGG
jgi:hypothetical protein